MGHIIFRDPVKAIGNQEDVKATDATSESSMVALLKWIGYLLSTGITTTPVAGGATEAKQDIGNTSLSVLDDWDETDRAKVNVIAGQAGVAAGAGASSAATPRVVTASDSPEIALFGAVNETAPATDTASSGANGRLQRIAQRITSLIALVPASLGGKTAAASFAVTTATDDPPLALLGAVAETAPATDTASSGLNGRLQRIAQRVTSVIALLPASLGSKVAASSFAVCLADNDWLVTAFGAKTDAKSTATDATSVSAMQVLKQISASVQAPPTQAVTVADGSNVVEGATTGAAVVTDADGTHQQYLRGLIKQWISSTLTFAPQAYSAAVSLTRTADAIAYTAKDVIGAAPASTAALTFASMGPSAGRIIITGASLEINVSAVISGMTSFVLHLYNVTPPSALGDNVAFDLPTGDRASYLGSINLGVPVDLGSTLYVEASGINKPIKLAGTSLFGYLVTVGAYTPSSAAVKVITLHSVAV